MAHVRAGSCKTLNRDRRNYSSKTALVAQLASEFNLEVELKNINLVAFRFFDAHRLMKAATQSRCLPPGCKRLGARSPRSAGYRTDPGPG